jgi:TPR repeat protein
MAIWRTLCVFIAGCTLYMSACGSPREANTDSVAVTLLSSDTETVYNAGVDAYRAKRFALARALWRRAADLRVHRAESNLGFLLYYGYGGPADSGLAAEYWRRAMTAHDAEAHRHVAEAILQGDARLGSLVDAYGHAIAARTLAKRAGQEGDEQVARDAQRLLDSLSTLLRPSQVAAAAEEGARWAGSASHP